MYLEMNLWIISKKILEYKRWDKFNNVIHNAKTVCNGDKICTVIVLFKVANYTGISKES